MASLEMVFYLLVQFPELALKGMKAPIVPDTKSKASGSEKLFLRKLM
jgi:hypothetical protein